MPESRDGSLASPPSHCRNCPAWEKSVFHALDPALLDRLAEHKVPRQHTRGDTFNEQGKPARQIYCLASGNAKVTHLGEKNRESIVRIASAGDLLGYRCIFSEETYRATATALEPVGACSIDTGFLFDLIRDDPRFSLELLKRMGSEVTASENRHHSFCQKDTRERIAEALLLLKERCGRRQGNAWRLEIQLTRMELSNWVGTAKETVIRCLSDFREEGLIRQDEDFLVILDESGLRRIARLG